MDTAQPPSGEHPAAGHLAAEKAAIGELAITLLREEDAIAVGPGSTTHAFARRLGSFDELTVLTNSLAVADELLAGRAEVLVSGGSLHGPTGALLGELALHALAGRRVQRTVLSGAGLSLARGLSVAHLQLAEVDRAMVAVAGEVIVLADHTKLDRDAPWSTVPLERIDHLVTDWNAAEATVTALRERGVNVHVAPCPTA